VLRLVVREPKKSKLTVRELAFADITKAVVQVEFSPPNQREIDLITEVGP
jgi:ribosome maturation factor RimP